jgi:hypothetical protein
MITALSDFNVDYLDIFVRLICFASPHMFDAVNCIQSSNRMAKHCMFVIEPRLAMRF